MDDLIITAEDVRAYANFPSDVPSGFLENHVRFAIARLEDEYASFNLFDEKVKKQAAIIATLISAYPWLNTFALDGAAKVGRLEGSISYKFSSQDDVDIAVERLERQLKSLLSNAQIVDEEAGESERELTASAGDIYMGAV